MADDLQRDAWADNKANVGVRVLTTEFMATMTGYVKSMAYKRWELRGSAARVVGSAR